MNLSKRTFSLGKNKTKVEKSLKKFDKTDLVKRIWDKDASVWKEELQDKETIGNRLGWLSLPLSMKDKCEEIISFVEELRKEGFLYAVVMGMGGSSMFPEVCLETFGIKEGYLRLSVLDSTDPKTISNLANSINIDKTLFIVSSKSGSTIEVDSFFRYFFEKVKESKGIESGKNFIAITDPHTQLESLATENNFRKIFTNSPDIGGRYSALSYFGLVPAALIGVDIKKLLRDTEEMMSQCSMNAEKNPGAVIGITAGELCKKGKDKLTFILPKKISAFGFWLEQLIAESTGKEGKGILPIEGEKPGKASSYGKDRLFVFYRIGKESKNEKKTISRLEKKNFPVIKFDLSDIYQIGGQVYLWEFATAVMGAVLSINPFDEPNVKESKDNTSEVLKCFETYKKLPEQTPQSVSDNLQLFLDEKLFAKVLPSKKKTSNWGIDDYMKLFLKQINKNNYVAIMAYIQKNNANEKILQKIREAILTGERVATTIGFGPRFLHSTGQFHKGGPNEGVFIQIISEGTKDLEIPGKPYSFGILKQAQAIGDYESLVKHERRVIKVNVGRNIERGLEELYRIIKKSV